MYNEGNKHIRESDKRLQLLCQQNHIKSLNETFPGCFFFTQVPIKY